MDGGPVMGLLDVSGRLLRETVLGIACQMGSPETLNEAAKIFDQWINGQIRYTSCGLSVVNFPYSNSMNYYKLTNGNLSVYSSSMCIISRVENRDIEELSNHSVFCHLVSAPLLC